MANYIVVNSIGLVIGDLDNLPEIGQNLIFNYRNYKVVGLNGRYVEVSE